jgi:hypothetical protein
MEAGRQVGLGADSTKTGIRLISLIDRVIDATGTAVALAGRRDRSMGGRELHDRHSTRK